MLSRQKEPTHMRALTKLLAVLLASSLAVSAQIRQPDLTRDPTLYVVAYAHLDTQWRWEYPRVINDYIPKTLHENFALIDKNTWRPIASYVE
jgi:alpha-mannosidase